MPTYDYRCKACGHELEVVQSFKDDPLTHCEACGAEELRKVFAAPGISFKGSGFYKTDSRGKSSSTSSSSSGSKTDTSSSSDASSSSSTPAASSSETSTTPATTSS